MPPGFTHGAGIRGSSCGSILYDRRDGEALAARFADRIARERFPMPFVLGDYRKGHAGSPKDLDVFLDWLKVSGISADWAVCALGAAETDCLLRAHGAGGKMRASSENSIWNADGGIAADNAERVAEVARLAGLRRL